MLISCNGLKSQSIQAAYCASIAHHNPDVIFGSECKISSDIATYPILEENYSMLKNYRNSQERGAFLAKETLITASMCNINVNCEIIWASLQLCDCKSRYVASYYGPHSSKQEALYELEESLSTNIRKQK